MSSDKPVNEEPAEENAVLKVTVAPKRTEVLCALWERARWFKEKIDNPRTQLNDNLKARAYFATIECQYYRAGLFGLKDEELEIRLMELEEKLKNSILIPKPEDKKK